MLLLLNRIDRVAKDLAALSGRELSVLSRIKMLKGEIAEFEEALEAKESDQIIDELGDILFNALDLCNRLGVGAERITQVTCTKLASRVIRMEQGESYEESKIECAGC